MPKAESHRIRTVIKDEPGADVPLKTQDRENWKTQADIHLTLRKP